MPPLGAPGAPDPPELDGVARRTSPLTAWGGGASVGIGLLLTGVEQTLQQNLATDPTTDATDRPWFLLLGIAFLILNGAAEILRWVLRTYTVDPDQLVIDEGVLTRHHRVVPIARVQQVDVNQKLLAQLFGLAELRMATAGEGGETTVVLRFLDRRRAEGLRSYLLRRRAELQARTGTSPGAPAGPAPPGAPPPPAGVPEVPVLALTPGQIARSGIGGPVGSVLIVAGTAVLLLAATAALRGEGDAVGLLLVVLLLAGGVACLGLLGAVLSAWDLQVTLAGDDLHLRQGLLEKRAVTLPRRRVQHVTVVDNPLQRALGFATVTLHSAAGHRSPGGGTGSFTIPYVATGAVPDALQRLLGGDWHQPALTPRGPAAHRRAIVRRAALGALAGAAALALGPAGVLLVVVGGALGALWGIAAHARAGWAVTPRLAVLAHGALLHRRELVPVDRVQSARTTASPFQRRVDLATVHLDVAGSSAPHLYDLEAAAADELRRRLPRQGPTSATAHPAPPTTAH